jgi:hypothetical protein
LYISIINFFCIATCVEINYTQPTNTRAFHFFALSAQRPRSCASGAQRPKDCPLKKREQVARAREREKRGGEPESGCGGAAEPLAASQDDALEPTLTARPPKAFKKKRGGWFAAEIETAKMTFSKNLDDSPGPGSCLLFEPVQHRADLSLSFSFSLSLCFAFLFISKIQNLDVHPPPTGQHCTLPTLPNLKKIKEAAFH